ncbi:hypothetical protein PP352_21750 [Mycobacteroides abscessus]|nr:hypothetical protein [Mycobacteroides abscessus]
MRGSVTQFGGPVQRFWAALAALGCPDSLRELINFQEAWPPAQSFPRPGCADPDLHCEGIARAWVQLDLQEATTLAPGLFGTLSCAQAAELDTIARGLRATGEILWALDVWEQDSWTRWAVLLPGNALHVAELLYVGAYLPESRLHEVEMALKALSAAVWAPAPANGPTCPSTGTRDLARYVNTWTLGPTLGTLASPLGLKPGS